MHWPLTSIERHTDCAWNVAVSCRVLCSCVQHVSNFFALLVILMFVTRTIRQFFQFFFLLRMLFTRFQRFPIFFQFIWSFSHLFIVFNACNHVELCRRQECSCFFFTSLLLFFLLSNIFYLFKVIFFLSQSFFYCNRNSWMRVSFEFFFFFCQLRSFHVVISCCCYCGSSISHVSFAIVSLFTFEIWFDSIPITKDQIAIIRFQFHQTVSPL